MPSVEENLHLCWLLLQQKMTDGKLEGIDWESIRTSLGLTNNAAATMRWSRLKKDLTDNGIPKASADGTPKKTPKKAATPKAKKVTAGANGNDEGTPVKKRASKKQKMEDVEDVEHVEEDVDTGGFETPEGHFGDDEC